MGGELACRPSRSAPHGLLGDREYAVYDADGKLASGKHTGASAGWTRSSTLVAAAADGDTVVTLPTAREVVAGQQDRTRLLSEHFGEPVTLRRETDVPHQDAAQLSIVGSATLVELGRHEGDGRPLDPRHLRANIVVQTTQPYAEEAWVGREVTIGRGGAGHGETTERCRMVGVAQVGLAGRPGMLKAISRPPRPDGRGLRRRWSRPGRRQGRPSDRGRPSACARSRLPACPRCNEVLHVADRPRARRGRVAAPARR